MQVAEVLERLGGVATHAQLREHLDRPAFEAALRAGELVRVARNRYALAAVDAAVSTAHSLSGVLCLTSAALHHGWAVKETPDRPLVSVRRNRKISAAQHRLARINRHDLSPDDVIDGIVTSKETTLLHCLRRLPDDEALAVADSALRPARRRPSVGWPSSRAEQEPPRSGASPRWHAPRLRTRSSR